MTPEQIQNVDGWVREGVPVLEIARRCGTHYRKLLKQLDDAGYRLDTRRHLQRRLVRKDMEAQAAAQ